MKKFTATSNLWKERKALSYFLNFIKNHDGSVNDNDTFELAVGLHTQTEWRELITQTFPAATLKRMQGYSPRRDRLDFDDEPKEMIREAWCIPFARKRMRTLLVREVSAALELDPAEKYAGEPYAVRVKELQKTLNLSDFELDVLLVFAFVAGDLLCIADGHSRSSDENDKAIFAAKSLNCDYAAVMEALDETHKLRRYQCIDSDFDFNNRFNRFLNGVTKDPLSDLFFTRCQEEVLPWDFYGDLAAKHGEMLHRILKSCNGKSGANVLLYGAPGTGKTSFARTLAEELHKKCYVIQQKGVDRNGRSNSDPDFRFGALQVCADQVDAADSLIIVDEADDMLRGEGCFSFFGMTLSSGNSGDKGLLNSVLDGIKVPTVWITNTAACELDPSSRRRFDYSIKFEPLSTPQRLAIWRNNVAKMKLGDLIGETQMARYAERYPVSAGGITLTLQNLVKLAPEAAEVDELVEKLMTPHCELLAIPRPDERVEPARDYSLEGLNIKGGLPLERIVEAVRNFQTKKDDAGIDRPRMNLLLSGAPGTGKTEFVKFLGKTLNTKVVVKMGSDLLNMYVGGTEQNIRRAFAEAEAEKAILFLDEIDGLVQSRERANQSWEVTQVNELLYQMENFKGVMVGATNFSANLDQAILRRFTFKLEFDYLNEEGKKLFFERMFQTRLSEKEAAELAAIPNLAPGDFRTVRQSLFYLDNVGGNAERLAALARESEVKQANRSAAKRNIGF